MTPSLTRQLTRILRRPIDPASRTRATWHLLDWIGCAAAGAVSPAGEILRAYGRGLGRGPCTAMLTDVRLPPTTAAFVNGGLGNILEMDDIHKSAILHPGPVVIPAALAAAQARNASAPTLLDAIIRGYEAMIRVGRTVGPGHYALWHNTASCGPFGAAAATASVAGLDEDRLVWALGNAGTQVSGPWRCRHEPVMTKQLHTARAAEAGLAAADLAAGGFTGPEEILEGEQGFFAATCPDPLPEALLAEADGPWLIRQTSFKPWPACRHAHAAIDAALALRARGIDADAIERIEIETYGDAARFCDRPTPTSELEAKFSLQHAVAVTLLDGPPALAAFGPAAIETAAAAALRARTSVRVVDRYQQGYPSRYGSGVAVVQVDGTRVGADVPDALGDPENPVDLDLLKQKATALMQHARLRPAQIDAVIAATLALADGGGLERLADALP